ncbi:MAG TPA: ABC transporter permease [Lacisediminihabitans sp.]|uniref:ABC transporter permease n=1 Tax=Lacisediminihabitans sp. TaxID=2787631 RepID=UPI002EDAF063
MPNLTLRRRRSRRRLFGVGWGTAGIIIFAVILLAAVFAPLLTPYRPLVGVGQPIQSPSIGHPMGTDDLGRDVFSQVLFGLRSSLYIGLFSALIALVVGAVVGAISGYAGGRVDDVLMRVTELFQVVPRIFLVIITASLFGQGATVTAVAIGLTSWPQGARLLRAEFLSRRESEYVMAARVIGASSWRIVGRELLPNAISPLVVSTTLNIATAVLLEASLAFLGLSDPNVSSLGRMLQSSIGFIQIAWWMSVFPGIVVALIALSMNMMGDSISGRLARGVLG